MTRGPLLSEQRTHELQLKLVLSGSGAGYTTQVGNRNYQPFVPT